MVKWSKLESEIDIFEKIILKIGKDKLLQELLSAQKEAANAANRARELYIRYIKD